MNVQRQLVFVTGEPGIGKTALVEEFLSQIDGDQTLRIGRGQCVELYGAGEAYLPMLEALGRMRLAAGGEQVVQILKQDAPTWLTQLPALLADPDLEAVQRDRIYEIPSTCILQPGPAALTEGVRRIHECLAPSASGAHSTVTFDGIKRFS